MPKRCWPTPSTTAASAIPLLHAWCVKAETMELEVDGTSVSIAFDHTLTDSEDAHRTLVAMLRAMPKEGA